MVRDASSCKATVEMSEYAVALAPNASGLSSRSGDVESPDGIEMRRGTDVVTGTSCTSGEPVRSSVGVAVAAVWPSVPGSTFIVGDRPAGAPAPSATRSLFSMPGDLGRSSIIARRALSRGGIYTLRPPGGEGAPGMEIGGRSGFLWP